MSKASISFDELKANLIKDEELFLREKICIYHKLI